ncbi:MAG: hypothetical protein M3Q34_03800 [bacterium]|nr:hypothetical protein [bacterium]
MPNDKFPTKKILTEEEALNALENQDTDNWADQIDTSKKEEAAYDEQNAEKLEELEDGK